MTDLTDIDNAIKKHMYCIVFDAPLFHTTVVLNEWPTSHLRSVEDSQAFAVPKLGRQAKDY
jgi:hypothetical protein